MNSASRLALDDDLGGMECEKVDEKIFAVIFQLSLSLSRVDLSDFLIFVSFGETTGSLSSDGE